MMATRHSRIRTNYPRPPKYKEWCCPDGISGKSMLLKLQTTSIQQCPDAR